MSRSKNIVRTGDLEWREMAHGEKYGFRAKQLVGKSAAKMIGCSLYEMPPGRRSFPYHYHCANEEAIYVLSGAGTIRLAGTEYPLEEGDYVALPAGEEGAHQVNNSSDKTLRFLCISTMIEPEIAVYPDSKKFGLFAGGAPGVPKEQLKLFTFLKEEDQVGYFEGEE